MTKPPRSWSKVLGFGLLVVIAYLSGRSHIAGRIWSRLHPAAQQIPVQGSSLVPRLPSEFVPSAAADELDALLLERVDSVARANDRWSEVMAEGKNGALALDALRRTMRGLFPAWTGAEAHAPPEVIPWFEGDGVAFSLVRLTVPPGSRLWVLVARPQAKSQPTPAILFLHGNGATVEALVSQSDYHHGAVAELARRGFLTVAPMMPAGRGESKRRLNLRALSSGWTLYDVETWQLTGVLDYLAGLEGVERSKIGVYGISAGGERALRLAALDSRVGAVIVSGFIADRLEWWHHQEHQALDAANVLPNKLQVLNDRNLMALIYPRRLGVESGQRDPRHQAARAVFEDVRRLYQRSGHADRIAFLEFPGGHETSLVTAQPFLDAWIRQPQQAAPVRDGQHRPLPGERIGLGSRTQADGQDPMHP
jgi:hypothetical protein